MTALIAAVTVAQVAPPPAEKVTPGIPGFLAVLALVVATVLLIRSMVHHLRKVRYSPDPNAVDDVPGGGGPAGGSGGAGGKAAGGTGVNGGKGPGGKPQP